MSRVSLTPLESGYSINVYIQIGITAEEHDEFVKTSPQTNLLQSSDWAKIKDNWGNERLGVFINSVTTLTALRA